MTNKNLPSFFQTLSLELNAQADRVRQLIGSSHWISDGSHKEALLRGVVERYVPDATVTSRAFKVLQRSVAEAATIAAPPAIAIRCNVARCCVSTGFLPAPLGCQAESHLWATYGARGTLRPELPRAPSKPRPAPA